MDSHSETIDIEDVGNFSITINKDRDGARISVSNIRMDQEKRQFVTAYRLIHELWSLTQSLDDEIEQHLEILELQREASKLWSEDENELSERVTDNSHKIALSLLKEYPKAVEEAEVVNNVDVKQPTANANLRGQVKGTKDYFKELKGGYQLTKAGIEWLKSSVIPTYITVE